MNKSGWKAGRYVIVGLDLTITYDNNGEDPMMEHMKGKKCKIKHANNNTIELYYKEGSREYFYFSKCDLRLVDDHVKITYPKPATFNPQLLDV